MILRRMLVGKVIVFLLFALIVPAYGKGNLLKNPGFEVLQNGEPENWYFTANPADGAVFKIDTGVSRTGEHCVSIANVDYNDAWVVQEVKVKRNKIYKLSYWLKIDQPLEKQLGGANISVINGIYSSPEYFDTRGEWEYHEAFVRTNTNSPDLLKVALRLGGYGAVNKGKAYFDDVVVEEVTDSGSFTVAELGNTDAPVQSNNSGQSSNNSNLFLYMLIGVIGLIGFIYLEFKLSGKKNAANASDESTTEDGDDF